MSKRKRRDPGSKYSPMEICALTKKLYSWANSLDYKEGRYSLVQFAVENGMSKGALKKIADVNMEFSAALEFARSCEEVQLANMSLDKKYPATATKGLLANYAGHRDNQEVDMKLSGAIKFIEDLKK